MAKIKRITCAEEAQGLQVLKRKDDNIYVRAFIVDPQGILIGCCSDIEEAFVFDADQAIGFAWFSQDQILNDYVFVDVAEFFK